MKLLESLIMEEDRKKQQDGANLNEFFALLYKIDRRNSSAIYQSKTNMLSTLDVKKSKV